MSSFRLLSPLFAALFAIVVHAGPAEEIAALLSNNRPEEALQRADEALLKSPRDARLRLMRGNALVAMGRAQEAVQVFFALTVDFPGLPEPYNNLAAVYAQQGQLERARQTLQMAMQTNPAYATAQANLADVYARLAAQAYDKALQRDSAERRQGAVQGSSTLPAGTPRLALVGDLQAGRAPLPIRPLPPVVSQPVAAKPQPTPPALPPVTTLAQAVPAKPAVPAPLKTAPQPTPTVSPAEVKPALKPVPAEQNAGKADEEQVLRAVRGWADAWSNKRVAAYLGYYGRGFKAPGGRADWEKQRRERIEAARKIAVRVERVRVKLDGDVATVRFVQKYRSDKLDTSTGKTLILQRQGGRWLIREERVG